MGMQILLGRFGPYSIALLALREAIPDAPVCRSQSESDNKKNNRFFVMIYYYILLLHQPVVIRDRADQQRPPKTPFIWYTLYSFFRLPSKEPTHLSLLLHWLLFFLIFYMLI